MNIGADTYPLHMTRLVEVTTLRLVAVNCMGSEAANVRGDVVNLLVRFRVMNIGKALLSRRSFLLTVEMRTSSGKLRTLVSRS